MYNSETIKRVIMGRIRQKWIKNLAEQLANSYPDKFSADFVMNKKSLDELKIIEDKLVRNKIAGYIVRIIEQKE